MVALIVGTPFEPLTATAVAGGGLLPLKGLADSPLPRERTVWLHEEVATISPFEHPDWHMVFTPERVVIETATGEVESLRSHPRAAFRGHVLETVWDALHRAYFNGYAIWTYLTPPS
jgi:hypothetical protein